MNTFLPHVSFSASATVLDRARLGKQRIEVLQLLRALSGETKGWVNHPACKMWRGYEGALVNYGLAVCNEWIHRGYSDTCLQKIWDLEIRARWNPENPPWLGDRAFHASHRAALLYKDPVHYGQFGWTEKPAVPNSKGSLPYVWPV